MDLLKQLQDEMVNFRSLEKANSHVKELKVEIDKQYAELHALEKKLDREYRDYEKLEGKSLKGFFYNVLGSKEKQLEKERQEYLQLSLKFDQLRESIKLKEFEYDVLKKKITAYGKSKEKIDRLKKQREAFLLRSNSEDSRRLRKIMEDLDAHVGLNVDIREAKEAGSQLIEQLQHMIQLLKKARNWGKWDMHQNQSRHYKRMKYSNIDRAKQMAYRIQHFINTFERELKDVYPDFEGLPVHFDLDRFNGFTDIFFDNLISDWIVQQKIVNSLNNVNSLHDRVTRLMQSLSIDASKVEERLEILVQRKDDIVLGK